MKFKKLLVLSALSLIGTSTWADVPDGVWTIPDPSASLEFTDFDVDDPGTHVYFYNSTAKMFFASGNDWNTRASIAAFGYEMWCEPSTEEDAPEGSYELWDDCQHPDRVLGYKNMFTDDGGSTWVDHASQGNYSWTVTKVGDAYRFQNVALVADIPEYDGKYLGWKGDYSDTKLYMITEEEGTIDWKAVTYDSYQAFIESEAYTAYKTGVDCYSVAISLKAALEEAEGLGANIATQLAVYTNTASTKDELQKAVDALKPIIEARKSLKKLLDEAKAAGFTATEAYDAVYANGDATEAELKKAHEDLGNDLVEWGKGHATVENPADMTSKIVNPNFDNASYSGWSGDAPNMTGSGAHGPANVPEKWNATFDTYQDIKDLPAGVYSLGCQTMWRGSWNDMVNKVGPASKLYVKVGDTEYSAPFNYAYGPLNTESMAGDTPWGVGAGEQSYTDEETGNTYYIPNDPSCFRLYAEKGLYDTKVLFGLSEGDIRIGTKNPAMLGDADNWSCWDTFTLTYYGAGSDAAKLYLDETIKNFSEKAIEEGTIYTEAYLTAYNEALKGDFPTTSFAELSEALGALDAANAAIDKNIELWKKWQDRCAAAYTKYVTDDKYADFDEVYELADYADPDADDYQDIINAHDWTNEKLEEEIAHVAAMCSALDEALKNATHHDGDDMTDFIINPGFDDDEDINYSGAMGWTIDRISGNTSTGYNIVRGPLGQGNKDLMESALGKMNYCFEAWHGYNWDIWQEIEGLPKGMYELNVQGYVRCEVGGYVRGEDIYPDYPSPVYLYMNSATAQFPSVYSESAEDLGHTFTTVESWTTESINDKLYPNSMGGAAQCFGWDMYKMKAYGLIAKKGDTFRIGVKMNANQDWWCIFDNFKLTYREPSVDVVKPILEEELEKIDLSKPMGKNVYEQASKVKADATAALASGDGDQMFDALVAVYDLSEAINTSVALFATLADANEDLNMKISDSKADEATKSEAKALSNKIATGIENFTIEDAEVEGLLAEIKAIKTKLGIPAGYANANDNQPADFTGVIENPAYDENADGWSGTGASWSGDGLNAEIFGKDYDYYQDIVGLPAGTYEVTVQGFYRAGNATTDYNTWIETPEENNNAFLYAAYINGTDTLVSSVPLKRLAAEAGSEEEGAYVGDGYVYAKDPSEEGAGDGWIVPNSMLTASYEFENGKYNNSVIVKLGSDNATLRIGLKKNVDLTDNWSIWDNWQINYFGTASAKEANSDPSGINNAMAKAAIVEFYNLNGARISKPAKGVAIMKQTLSDGTVRIQKVTVK